MNKAELQAIKNKRQINIQKLDNYLKAGKTEDEKIVQTVIKNIKDAEKILQENNFTFDYVNDNNILIGEKLQVEKKNRYVVKKSLQKRVDRDITKIGVSVREDLLTKVEILAQDGNKKVNPAIVEILETIFDGTNFKVEFEKKVRNKVTSFNLPTKMKNSIEKIHKDTDIPVSVIFNILLEKALNNFFDS